MTSAPPGKEEMETGENRKKERTEGRKCSYGPSARLPDSPEQFKDLYPGSDDALFRISRRTRCLKEMVHLTRDGARLRARSRRGVVEAWS